MYGCVEKVLIQGVIPCMPRGSLILVSLSSSSIPRISIHIYIKRILEIRIYIYIYIYLRKMKKNSISRMKLHI